MSPFIALIAGPLPAKSMPTLSPSALRRDCMRMHVPECLRMQSRRKADDDVVGINFIGNGASVAASAGNEGACLDSTVAAP